MDRSRRDGEGAGKANVKVKGQAGKKVMAKDLLGPMMAGEGGGIISSELKVIAMGLAPALISFREKN